MMFSSLAYFAVPYLLIPGAGAAIAAWFVSGWRSAAVVIAGALAFVLAFQGVLQASPGYPLPGVIGAGIGAVVLLPLLLVRPQTPRRVRMLVATLVTMAAGAWLVFSNPGIA